MNISASYSPNFDARRLTVSQAREMKFRVGEMFPYTSNWKLAHVDYYDILKRHNYMERRVSDETIIQMNNEIGVLNDLAKKSSQMLRTMRNEYTQFIREPLEYFKKLASGILKYKSANCGEIARLMYMVSRINDVNEQDVYVAKLAFREKQISSLGVPMPFKEVDHVILSMKCKDGEIGIDGILDETASIEDLKKIYAEKYGKILNIPKGAEIGLLPVDDKTYSIRSIPRLEDYDAENLRAMFPSLFIE